MLGKTQAVANEPYQVYQGPMTAGQSNLQSKVFQGLGGLSFPGNLGQSFASPMGGQQPQMQPQTMPMGNRLDRPQANQQMLTPYSGGRPTDVMGGDYMGGRRGPAIPFAQNMGQLGIPAGLDDTMTPDIMAANAATQQRNAASRANSAANPASISDLSKRLGLMGGFAVSPQQGQMPPSGGFDTNGPDVNSPYFAGVGAPVPSGMGGNAPQDMPTNLDDTMSVMGGGSDYWKSMGYENIPDDVVYNSDGSLYVNQPQPNQLARYSEGISVLPQQNSSGVSQQQAMPQYMPEQLARYDKGTGGASPSGIASLTPPPQVSQQPSNIAQSYMNPYLQSVLNPQLDELRRQNEITNMQANAKLTGAGAFGGGRQAIINAENARNLMQEQNKTVGQGYASAYDKAMGQFNTEQGQSKDLVNMLANAGQAERGIEQEGITADYNEFLAQRDDPMKKTQYLQSMLQGLPISTVTNSPLGKSGMGQLAEITGSMPSVEKTLRDLGLLPPA
jgi:hypothetical protein